MLQIYLDIFFYYRVRKTNKENNLSLPENIIFYYVGMKKMTIRMTNKITKSRTMQTIIKTRVLWRLRQQKRFLIRLELVLNWLASSSKWLHALSSSSRFTPRFMILSMLLAIIVRKSSMSTFIVSTELTGGLVACVWWSLFVCFCFLPLDLFKNKFNIF